MRKTTKSVFISYRRDDSRANTERLYDHLVSSFGSDCLFKDVDSIVPGENFVEKLDVALEHSSVMIAVIGENWLSLKDADGVRRIDQPNDYVRGELESAFSRGIPVIPVLVDCATIPPISTLPDSISQLARQQALELRADPDFGKDVRRLEAAIESHGVGRKRRTKMLLLASTGVITIAILTTFIRDPENNHSDLPSSNGTGQTEPSVEQILPGEKIITSAPSSETEQWLKDRLKAVDRILDQDRVERDQ